jgi:calcineurin-like phosphoesterase family protein
MDNDDWSEFVVSHWNSIITNDDTVYIGGDIGLNRTTKIIEYLERLKGSLVLIEGNHDKKPLKDPAFRRCFKAINDCNLTYREKFVFTDEKVEEREIWVSMTHYPILSPQGHIRHSVNLCGHIHSTYHMQKALDLMNNYLMDRGIPHRQINVGLTTPWMNFAPKTLQEIMIAQDYYAKKCESYQCWRVR